MVSTVDALQQRGLSVETPVLAVDAVHDGAALAAACPTPALRPPRVTG